MRQPTEIRPAVQPVARRRQAGPTASPAEPGRSGVRTLTSARVLAFAGLCAACLLIATGYAALAIARASRVATAPVASGSSPLPAGAAELLYVKSDGGFWEGAARMPLPTAGAEPQLLGLQCQRVHFAAGQGL